MTTVAGGGSHEQVLQHLKQLWHVLVQYGEPASLSGAVR
ncbi:MAG: DUF3626 domain-containing protein [Nitrospira sp.]|nr:DUF3626 domain-containing protein [Nitrospira sp.]